MSKADNQKSFNNAQSIGTNVAQSVNNVTPNIQGLQTGAQTAQTGDKSAVAAATGTANNTLANAGNNLGQVNNEAETEAQTGGFTPEQESQYMNQATSGVKNSFDVLGQQAKLNQLRTGAASGPAAIAQIARQGGQAQSSTEQGAAVNLNQQINANKNSGLSAATGANTALTGVAGQQNQSGAIDASLYNADTGEVTAQGAQLLQALGLQYNTQAEAAQLLGQIGNNIGGPLSDAEGIAGIIGNLGKGAAGAASAYNSVNNT